eukprot:TRINITY_DN1715_c0_g1_i1.p1 TRINITY_DN1715_c0_g1~~TRINITY_DN1715_c0_g1_i1.p1  ORF type:complete len:831 (+),score=227.48 TRINITY_DN1715_c0_g1_i1:1-2493(+)
MTFIIRKVFLQLVFFVLIVVSLAANEEIQVIWNFTESNEGWGKGTFTENNCQIDHSKGEAHMYGSYEDTCTFISPLFKFEVTDHHYIILRLRYYGPSISLDTQFRVGSIIPPDEFAFGESDWTGTESDFHKQVESFELITRTLTLIGDGAYHIYYVPLFDTRGDVRTVMKSVTQIRMLFPAERTRRVIADWVAIAEAPSISHVEGCNKPQFEAPDLPTYIIPAAVDHGPFDELNKYYDTASISGVEPSFDSTKSFGATYNCLEKGGDIITITGYSFGDEALATVDGKTCSDVQLIDIDEGRSRLQCKVPEGTGENVAIEITNGVFPGLSGSKPYLSYQISIESGSMSAPTFSNIGAHTARVHWTRPTSRWEYDTITGYAVAYRPSTTPAATPTIIYVANVLSTILIGLPLNTELDVSVAAMVGDQVTSDILLRADLYYRRDLLDGELVGGFGPSAKVMTLEYDFSFPKFTALSTTNQGPTDSRISTPSTGETQGSGHYGIWLVGDANLAGCSSSSVCCDDYDEDLMSCPASGMACTSIPSTIRKPDVSGGSSHEEVMSNEHVNGITITEWTNIWSPPTVGCGPALRLTLPAPNQIGAAWYRDAVQLREGFKTEFEFNIHSPSLRCRFMDDEYTHCETKGADGLAFVIQNHEGTAQGSDSVGYGGIEKALAVEFDTFYNSDLAEPWENHVSVQSKGAEPLSAAGDASLGHVISKSLTSTQRKIKIEYIPHWDPTDAVKAKASALVSAFVAASAEGPPAWGRVGTLRVYLDDMQTPMLTVPLDLEWLLDLGSTNGRAWIGFTASTGTDHYQVHDILNWEFWSQRVADTYKTE